jgi:hypothetical protein
VDESKSKKFIMAAVQIDSAEAPRARKVLSGLRLKGQQHIHFANEGPSRRRRILSEITKIDLHCTFLVTDQKDEKQGRQNCLNELIETLIRSEEYLIILDYDENHIVSDKQVIRSALEKRGLTSLVTYRHERSRSQPLLWLPDILAWTLARSGEWSKSLSRFTTTTKRVP